MTGGVATVVSVVAAVVMGGCGSAGSQAAAGSPTASSTVTASTTTADAAPPSTSTASTASTGADAAPPAAGSSSPGATATGAVHHPCQAGHIKVQLAGLRAGLGHRSDVVLFTNTGPTACSLTGYPTVKVTNHAGTVIATADQTPNGYMGGVLAGATSGSVDVAPGAGSASAMIEWLGAAQDGAPNSPANCVGMDGGQVVVTVPGTPSAFSFPVPQDICAGFQVHPVVKGTTGRTDS